MADSYDTVVVEGANTHAHPEGRIEGINTGYALRNRKISNAMALGTVGRAVLTVESQ